MLVAVCENGKSKARINRTDTGALPNMKGQRASLLREG